MARIIGGSMIGELSGKLGGNVFARNKGGAYIRQYVVPVDPKSQAQINARNSFGFASSSYHALASDAKAVWQSFAQNFYLPKNGANTGQFSGFNAFTSLANMVGNANRLRTSQPSYTIDGANVLLPTYNEFELSLTAPTQQIQANIRVGESGVAPLYLSEDSEINSAGHAAIILNIGNDTVSPVPSAISLPLTDGASNKIGFAVYISNPVQQENMYISNPERYCLGFVPNLAGSTPSITTGSTIGFTVSTVNPELYQAFPAEGNYVRLTVYSVSENGQTIRIGSRTVQIVAP